MPIDLLTYNDCKMLTNFIKEFGYYNGDIVPDRIMKHFNFYNSFRFWNEAKSEHLLQLLGGELMVSFPVKVEKPETLIKDEILMLLNTNPFAKAYYFWISRNFERLYNLAEDSGKNPGYIRNRYDYSNLLENLIYSESIINNKRLGWNTSTFYLPLPDGTFLAIPDNCKPMRILKKIADAFDIDGYEEFRIAHSQILNQKMLKGKLTISIHPMDYFTMSMNSCGWTSCMRWPDGEYHQGTIEMMNSPNVVVAYLESNEPYHYSNIDPTAYWNNKKWRQLFIVNHDFISEIKAYPYCNETLTNIVINTLRDLADKNLDWQYFDPIPAESDTERDDDGYLIFTDELERNWQIYLYTYKMYNDINTRSNILIAPTKDSNIIHNSKAWGGTDSPYCEVYYSGQTECMLCGIPYPDIDHDESFCYSCKDMVWQDLY